MFAPMAYLAQSRCQSHHTYYSFPVAIN